MPGSSSQLFTHYNILGCYSSQSVYESRYVVHFTWPNWSRSSHDRTIRYLVYSPVYLSAILFSYNVKYVQISVMPVLNHIEQGR